MNLRQTIFAKRKKHHVQNVTAMIPNIITIMSLCSGMTAIRFALLEQWQYAVIAVLVSAVLDALDGRLARLLNSSSRMGAELDSFSDFLCFGVSPALIMYMKVLHHFAELGWAIALFFTMCMALRLARFNVMNQVTEPSVFFTGVPAPMAGYIGLFPLILSFACPTWTVVMNGGFCAFFMVVSSLLMVSRIPTFSLKKVFFKQSLVVPFLLMFFMIVGTIYSYPWQSFSIFGMFYFCTIPASLYVRRRFKRRHDKQQTKSEPKNTNGGGGG